MNGQGGSKMHNAKSGTFFLCFEMVIDFFVTLCWKMLGSEKMLPNLWPYPDPDFICTEHKK
jgi:hypothetical protein